VKKRDKNQNFSEFTHVASITSSFASLLTIYLFFIFVRRQKQINGLNACEKIFKTLSVHIGYKSEKCVVALHTTRIST